MTAAGTGQNSLIGMTCSAASKGIARVAGRTTTDGTAVPRFANSVDSANALFANVDTSSPGAVLRIRTIVIVVALRSATGDRVRLGKETRLAATDSHAKRADHTIRIGATRIRTAGIVT